ncbi:Cupin domain protein [Phycisphaerae bacterium RAS1]|nr:Cupin domain protein [Phycisphaerae bacterium RAS1]
MPAVLFDPSAAAIANLAELISTVPGGIVSKVLFKSGGVQQTLFALDAGQSIREHRVPYAAIVQVIDGSLNFRVGQRVYEMKTHDWLLMPADAPHALDAPGPARFLLTLMGAG